MQIKFWDILLIGSLAVFVMGIVWKLATYEPDKPKYKYHICDRTNCYDLKEFERTYECIKFLDETRTLRTICGYYSMVERTKND